MKEIIKILQNYKLIKKDFYWYLWLGIIMETLYVMFPYFTKELYSIIELHWEISTYYFVLGWLAIFSTITLWISFFWEYFYNKMWLVLYPIKLQQYRTELFTKNYEQINSAGTWKLIAKISAWAEKEVDIFISLIQIWINALYRGILIVLVISFIFPKLLIFLIIAATIIFIVNHFLRKYIIPLSAKEQEIWEEDGRNGARLIMENFTMRYFWKSEFELDRSGKKLMSIVKYGTKVDTANSAYYKLLELILRLLEVVFFFIIWGAILQSGTYEISFLILLTSYVWYLWWPIDKAVGNMNKINREWSKYMSLQKFVALENPIINGSQKYSYDTWTIEFRKINFSYSPERKIFENLDVKFLSWKKNALVGHSGWWKSTITKLILRLYDTDSWEILLDWQEIKSLDIGSVYHKIWYLPQEPAIFDGTIRENMGYAFGEEMWMNEKIDSLKDKESLIWEALKKAQIDDMVKKLDKQLDTEVWEKGVKLSGWEKQRLAIARIFLKNPKIIILDEPTSALDSISEAKVTQSLERLTKWKTSIVIAHRLQTVMDADKIIVIEDWKIQAEGIHKELIVKSDTYKKLVDLQNWRIWE